jgi:hypothetical protein
VTEQITAKEATRELVKLSVLVAITFILLVNILGFMVTKFYMTRAMVLPAITRILIELQHALRINIFFTIPLIVFVIILPFLLENFVVKNHIVTYGIYKKINLFLIVLNVLIAVGIVLPIIR